MMEMALMLAVTILAFAATQSLTEAFLTPQNHARKIMKSTGPLFVGPTYDKTTEKWSPSSDEEGPEAGYGIGKTFLLHGPEPTFQRLFRADNYEQAVLKFMAGDKVGRNEAQGNMDRFLTNAQDWQFERFEMQVKGIKYDYVPLKPKQAVLTGTWASIVFVIGGRLIYAVSHGMNFWDFGPFAGGY